MMQRKSWLNQIHASEKPYTLVIDWLIARFMPGQQDNNYNMAYAGGEGIGDHVC